jgi:g-D-glutamyl-meso-diaminopimelate peptidase
MSIVRTDIPITSQSCDRMILEIIEAYPFCRTEVIAKTAYGRPLRTLVIGTGPRKVIYTAAHHANEWITSLVLLKYAEDLAEAISQGGCVFGVDAQDLASKVTIYMVPMVDPDGVDLVVGAIGEDSVQFSLAQSLSQNYPAIPFPDGWKANLLGVDLNLQYPAGWLQAREIKFAQGYDRPGPRDFVGRAPLAQRESIALAEYTEAVDPALVLAYHTQGQVIYWQYQDLEVPGARELAEEFSKVSGYALEDVPYASGFAGYKDWFIRRFRRPGFTVEAGLGENPLPIGQFDKIYRDNIGILVTAALGLPA